MDLEVQEPRAGQSRGVTRGRTLGVAQVKRLMPGSCVRFCTFLPGKYNLGPFPNCLFEVPRWQLRSEFELQGCLQAGGQAWEMARFPGLWVNIGWFWLDYDNFELCPGKAPRDHLFSGRFREKRRGNCGPAALRLTRMSDFPLLYTASLPLEKLETCGFYHRFASFWG